MKQRTLISLLVVALVAVLGASAAVLLYLPNGAPGAAESPAATYVPDASTSPVAASPASFSTNVLQRSDYQALDQKLIQQGSIPVQPPQGTGKSNLFQ
jgi:hypothetical protein